MRHEELAKLLLYWNSTAFKEKSKRGKLNRGVPMDEDGNFVEDGKAPCTSTNGPKPMSKDIEGFKRGNTLRRRSKNLKGRGPVLVKVMQWRAKKLLKRMRRRTWCLLSKILCGSTRSQS